MSESKKVSFTLIEVGIVVLVLAMMTLMIVPSFMRKVKEARTTEATENLRTLFNDSVAYFDEQVRSGRMNPDRAVFPPSTDGAFPSEIGKSPVNTADWHMIEAFRALEFEINEPHYYQYQYESSGEGQDARFVVSAFGDLDGDGKLSRYQVEGYVENWEVRGENVVVDRYE